MNQREREREEGELRLGKEGETKGADFLLNLNPIFSVLTPSTPSLFIL